MEVSSDSVALVAPCASVCFGQKDNHCGVSVSGRFRHTFYLALVLHSHLMVSLPGHVICSDRVTQLTRT